MADLFISHVEEDQDVAMAIAAGLESAGYTSWYYERDCVPGQLYLIQVGQAIEEARAVVLVISPRSIASVQVTNEVVRAYESGKPFVPVLHGIVHSEFQRAQPVWRQCLGAAAAVAVPPKGPAAIVPRIVLGLKALGVDPRGAPAPPPPPPPAPSAPRPATEERTRRNSLRNELVRIPEPYLPQGHPQGVALWAASGCVSNTDYLTGVIEGGVKPPAGHPHYPGMRTWQGRSSFPEELAEHPVVFVRHEQAKLFCAWLTKRDQAKGRIGPRELYALPTVRHWLALARSARLTDQVVTDRDWEKLGRQPTAPVREGDPGALGIYHLLGNVFEWCLDSGTAQFRRGDQVYPSPYGVAIGGGWASSRAWLEEQVSKGTYGALRCPGGWPMKDGGFRLWLVAEET